MIAEAMMVQYKSLDFFGYPAFRVGNDGSVWHRHVYIRYGNPEYRWYRRKLALDRDGYILINLHDVVTGKKNAPRVHTLVLLAFFGPCPPGMECRHLDGDTTNNRVGNLLWGTPEENLEDRRRHELIFGIKKKKNRAFCDIEIQEIRALAKQGMVRREIAKRYHASIRAIRNIVSGKSWAHIQERVVA